MKKKTALLVAPKRFEIIEEELQPPSEGEIQVRITASGLCHSDLPVYLGESSQSFNELGAGKIAPVPFPFRFGHEVVGVVEQIGSGVNGIAPGDYVSGLLKPGYASHVVCGTRNVYKLPTGPKDPGLCILEPLMCVVNILRAANPEFGDTAAVVGCGCMGILTIAGLKRSGARNIVALDLLDSRLELAKSYGATQIINPSKEDAEKTVFELTGGKGAEVVIEISGSLHGLDTALSMMQNATLFDNSGRGKLLIPSLYGRDAKWRGSTGYALMFKAPIVHSTHPRYAPNAEENFIRGISAYMDGDLPLDSMITHRYSLENIEQGFEKMASGDPDMIKAIVVP